MNTSEIISTFGKNEKDTGSTAVQVAILTYRIRHLTEHLKEHRKDFSSKRGMIALTNLRRKLLNYLKKHNPECYQDTIKKLDLRK